MSEAHYFATTAELRAWFERHHQSETELIVGFYRKSSGHPSITWPEAVDQALCFGWIDSIRRRVDGERYTNRFTPRKATSNWSAINIRRLGELEAEGLVHPAGRAAFERRTAARSRTYSYEQRYDATLEPDEERRFRGNAAAWDWFQAAAPSYRASATWWVVSAKRAETRERRLDQLIADSAGGRRVPPYRPRQ